MKHSFHHLQTRDLKNHGLFGRPLQLQHMMMDDKWSPADLSEQFNLMNNILGKQHQLNTMKTAHKKRGTIKKLQNLRKDCREGRSLLSKVQVKANRQVLRKFLWESKEHRCLYQDMPVRQVLENVNNRTFGLRKEYDRLSHRKKQLEEDLKKRRFCLATHEDIDKFNTVSQQKFDRCADNFRRKLATCNTRVKAFEAINIVYKKIKQVLKHDEIFYDSILQSLRDDMNEQKTLIEYILNLGKPVLQKFHKLEEEFKEYDHTSLKSIEKLLNSVTVSKTFLLKLNKNKMKKFDVDDSERLSQAREHYMHTTRSMSELQKESQRLSDIIKHMQFITVCPTSKEVYPRVKGQVDQNYKLKKQIICGSIRHATMETREKFSEVLEEVIRNNLSQAETDRENRIKELRELMTLEDAREEEINQAIRKSNDVLVIIRFFLWNVNDMLHHVYKNLRLPKVTYPNSYLQLPLLRFEMLTMRAYPPEPMDEDFKTLMSVIRRKLNHLLGAYNKLSTFTENKRPSGKYKTMAYRDAYINEYIQRARDAETLSLYLPIETESGYGLNYSNPTARPQSRAKLKAQSIQLIEDQNNKKF